MATQIHAREWLARVKNGAQAVIAQQEQLNAINVYPVADHDTGSNLASLMRGLLTIAPCDNYADLAPTLCRVALQTARGNSGTIMCQFFCHFIPQVNKDLVSTEEWVELFQQATKAAYESIENPAQGTILTVMQNASDQLSTFVAAHNDISQALTQCLPFAKQALQKTTQQLSALQQSHVIDAGACGFYYFLEGMTQASQTDTAKQSLTPTAFHLHDNVSEKPELRYCTEVLFDDCQLSATDLNKLLSQWGDSLVIAGKKPLYRIHIHTNFPTEVISALIKLQIKLLEQKVDDMLMQFQLQLPGRNKVAVITDSVADIPQQLIDQHLIHVLPIEILVDDIAFQDKLTIDHQDIQHNILQQKAIKTSSPNSYHVRHTLSALKKLYDNFLFITVAKAQSGTYNRIKNIAEDLQLNYTIIDSLRNSAAQGLLVLQAAKLARNNSLEQLTKHITALRLKSQIVVAIQDIQPMIRSGRLGKVSGKLIKHLKIKPLVTLDNNGSGCLHSKTFGFNSALNKLARWAAKQKPISYVISHADAEQTAKRLASKVESLVGYPPQYITQVSAAVLLHAGTGCVAVSVLTA
ncbi:MAG: DegV family protein [Coxiellaceae bacterium]|nr:DegV family protein [Coxiellaceae bacterium]